MARETCSGELETSSAQERNDLENEDEVSLEQLPRVGETRANRLREAGLETARQLADADVESIAELLPVHGETTAKRLKGSAQGYTQVRESDSTEEDPFVYPADEADSDDDSPSEDGQQRRVVILAGEGKWEDRHASQVGNLIDSAFDRLGIDADRVGVPSNGNGGEAVREVWETGRSELLEELGELQVFDPDWPDDDEEMDSDDWRELFRERDQDMMMWATDVVVVEEGDYVGSTLGAVGDRTRPTVHTFLDENETLTSAAK